jgi:hypothetical protein
MQHADMQHGRKHEAGKHLDLRDPGATERERPLPLSLNRISAYISMYEHMKINEHEKHF